MCRIAGIVNKQSESILADTLMMRDAMSHGGPDDAGIYHDSDNGVCLGHRRLSIIDLSDAGHQPMHDDADALTIVFNGEIYNYRELQTELKAAGFVFKTNSDTEVIIKAYRHWGDKCFSKMKGMFAIALYNKSTCELLLVRDSSGIKPLYYYLDDESLYFASEIKALKKIEKLNHESEVWKIAFLTFGFLPEPFTTLQNVVPLAKGIMLTIDVAGMRITKQEMFCYEDYSSKIEKYEDAVIALKDVLSSAVDRHMIADAPIGLFLSGGIDSSLLSLIAHNTGHKDLHTLSIVFDDAVYSEEQYQKIIAQKINSDHKSYRLTKELFTDALPDIFRAMDQPTTDGVNTYFICKFAKEAGLKAVLSGLGADELFGGYASFKREQLIRKVRKVPATLLQAAAYLPKDKQRKISFLSRKDSVGDYLFHRGYFSIRETATILNASSKYVAETLENIQLPGWVDKLQYGNKVSYLERNIYMQSQLLKDTDMMSMWHGIEVRVPFLDVELIALANNISPEIKYGNPQSKHLLIDAFKDILPEEIWNRKKQGFVFPFQKWMSAKESAFFVQAKPEMANRYSNGKINWSRYWAYMVAENYATAH
ncbi:MAG: asparagine synthase (glutamine-hydrolyzing) [Flavipsychrobacter sp.]|nr:asparagine synthase (glutamine-hydrolyzing) [Flavipsychrobacter sp.]